MSTSRIAKGSIVRYDARANGIATGTVEKRVVIKSFYPGKPAIVFYQISGAGLLVPAADVLAA